jgi:aspartyl-tRNA(Asn)/glutamyl-tRNA(Gln) amidotransferase subunit A
VAEPALNERARERIAEQLRQGELSSSSLVHTYLERIERSDAAVGAFVMVTADAARKQAAAADAALEHGRLLGPLHGLPVALKDNIATAGVQTTIGSKFFADHIPDEDAEVARRLREAGAVLIGKAALHEFAYGATTQNRHYGPCRNPWDLARIPGGSSGGSGAAVAAGMTAAALGTDTGGSVRIPAALNGVSAIRPTFGRVSNRGVFPITWTFDTVGPMARAVTDLAPLLSVISGFDADDPGSVDVPREEFARELERGVEGLRFGVPRNFFFDGVDHEIVTAVRRAGDVFDHLGAEVKEIEVRGAEATHEQTTQIIWAEAHAIHRSRLEKSPELFGGDVHRRLLLGQGVSGADYAECRQRVREWRRDVERLFGAVDIVLSPTTGIVAPLAEESETIETTRQLTQLTYAWSLAALPALAIPCGFSANGLPIGLQLAAARWHEGVLLRAGAAYQRETNWHVREPPLVV